MDPSRRTPVAAQYVSALSDRPYAVRTCEEAIQAPNDPSQLGGSAAPAAATSRRYRFSTWLGRGTRSLACKVGRPADLHQGRVGHDPSLVGEEHLEDGGVPAIQSDRSHMADWRRDLLPGTHRSLHELRVSRFAARLGSRSTSTSGAPETYESLELALREKGSCRVVQLHELSVGAAPAVRQPVFLVSEVLTATAIASANTFSRGESLERPVRARHLCTLRCSSASRRAPERRRSPLDRQHEIPRNRAGTRRAR